jgi:hypothetical protein
MLEAARNAVSAILENDYDLVANENQPLKAYLQSQKGKTRWSKIA